MKIPLTAVVDNALKAPQVNGGVSRGLVKKVMLMTLPEEGQFVNWTTHRHFKPQAVKYMPLGILSLASNLPKDRYEIQLLDASSHGYTIDETIGRIEAFKPDVLGITSVDRKIWALNRILRETTVPWKAVGGPHVTHYGHHALRNGADAIFVGPLADTEFRNAVAAVDAGNPPRGRIDCETNINDIAFPQRGFLDVGFYFPKEFVLFEAQNRLPMFSSVGCPQRCTFCNVQTKKPQLKNPEAVLDEMAHLYEVGCRSVHVLDDNFNVMPGHLEAVSTEMQRRGFKSEWSGRGQVRMRSYDPLTKLTDYGFKRIHVGIEHFDPDVLQWFHKPETPADIDRFCGAMNGANIDMLGYFIIGTPLEMRQDKQNYVADLPAKIRERNIKHPFFNVLYPEPDTEYYRSLVRDGTYKTDIWTEYMANPTPDFEIPYPYGPTRRDEVMAQVQWLIDNFKTKRVASVDAMAADEPPRGLEEKRAGFVRQE